MKKNAKVYRLYNAYYAKKKVTLGLTRWHSGMRICLPMQGTWVRSLVWEDCTHQGAAKPVDHRD